jgi:serine/threonine-protein kinase
MSSFRNDTADFSDEHEAVIRRFEAAWRADARPTIEHFLPAEGHTQLLYELVHVDLDLRLRRGEGARVEHYLTRFPALRADRAAVLELIAAEFALRRQWQGAAAADEYHARFPQFRDDLPRRLRLSPDPSLSTRPYPSPTAARPTVPGYQVLDELGRGGMGVVYRAYQPALDRTVALKTLLPGQATPEELARFRREAEVIARLNHPHIVTVYEVGAQNGLPYFGMKFYPGGSLLDRVQGPTADPRAAARLMETLARAVHHAHQRGVLHRDLKPSNILLDEAGEPHVADFGLAKRFDPTAGPAVGTGVVGTPSYIAPEQARGDREVTTATDVYGLGAVLYELLTGEPPFLAHSPLATLAAVVERSPRPPRELNPRVPADLETICLKCLEKEPARRYGSAADLADDLGRWAAGEPISARRAGRLERGLRWCRRRPREAAIVALAVALFVMALGSLWSLDRQQARRRAEQELLQEQARGRVRGVLEQVPALRDRFLWAEAKALLHRANEEVEDFGLDELRAVVAEAGRELELAAALDEIKLDRATVSDEPGHGRAEAVAAYHRAVRGYGLDFAAADEAELTRRVIASPSREELVSTLHFLATYDPRHRAVMRAVARAAEPDEWKRVLAGIPANAGVPEIQTRLRERLVELGMPELSPGLVSRVGRLLSETAEGQAMLKAAQRRHPADFWLNFTLGNALGRAGRPDEAVGYLHAARAVRPGRAVVQQNLGVCYHRAGRMPEAVEYFREAVRLDPAKPLYLLNLGVGLTDIGDYREAVSVFDQALRLRPDDARVHCHLGFALRETGQFEQSLASLRCGHELGKKEQNWKLPSEAWVRDGEQLLEYETRLAAGDRPRDAEARVGFARVCRGKGRHAEATAFYAEAVAAGATASRVDAARSAVAAGRRAKALDWLTAEFESRPPAAMLRKWQHYADLAAVRDEAALAALPPDEATAWRAFWQRVADAAR